MAPVATDFCSRLKRGYEVLDDQRRCRQDRERSEVGGIEGVGTDHHKRHVDCAGIEVEAAVVVQSKLAGMPGSEGCDL